MHQVSFGLLFGYVPLLYVVFSTRSLLFRAQLPWLWKCAETIPPGKWIYPYGSLRFVLCLRICNFPSRPRLVHAMFAFLFGCKFCMIRWFYTLMPWSFCHLSSLWPTTHLVDRVLVLFRGLHSNPDWPTFHSLLSACHRWSWDESHPAPLSHSNRYCNPLLLHACKFVSKAGKTHISSHCYAASVPKNSPMQDMYFHVHSFPISSQCIWWGCCHTA